MGKARDWADEYTLLCEDCGYPIETLPRGGACPECGRPIRDSVPEQRSGSAWQARPGVRSWLRTSWAVLRRPRALFATVQIEQRRARALLLVNVVAAGALVSTLLMARLMTGRHWGLPWVPKIGVYAGEWRVLASLALGVGTIAITAGVLWLLTWIEVAGVRFFHARRGWRVTRAVAWSVCAHASIGWVVGAALLVLGWGLIDLDFWLARSLRTMTVRPRVGDWAAVPAGAGFFAGMMLFEYRVYQGMRVCRFANRRRPDPHAAIPR